MLSNSIPAAAFTAATTAPAALPSALDVLDFAGRHCLAAALVASAAVLLLVVRGFGRDASQHRAITSACARWEATGQPVAGWGPGWAWSPRPGEPVEDQEDDQEEELAAAEGRRCESCHVAAAVLVVGFAGGPSFAVCEACAPAGFELDTHAPTTFGRAS